MKTGFVRSMLVLAFSFVLVWTFASTLCREVGRAFRYAWLDVKIEISSFRKLWREVPEHIQ